VQVEGPVWLFWQSFTVQLYTLQLQKKSTTYFLNGSSSLIIHRGPSGAMQVKITRAKPLTQGEATRKNGLVFLRICLKRARLFGYWFRNDEVQAALKSLRVTLKSRAVELRSRGGCSPVKMIIVHMQQSDTLPRNAQRPRSRLASKASST